MSGVLLISVFSGLLQLGLGQADLLFKAPRVKDVSAMCTADGITASISFDGPFSGIIYSTGYSTVHQCVYFNAVLAQSVLFSIPNQGCGTRITHNTQEVLETVENRVYVQMDKLTQTVADRQYSFVCQQAYMSSIQSGSEIRRHPVSSKSVYHNPTAITPITPIRNPWGNNVQPSNDFASRNWRPELNELHGLKERPYPLKISDALNTISGEDEQDWNPPKFKDLKDVEETHPTESWEDSDMTSTMINTHPFTLPPLKSTSTTTPSVIKLNSNTRLTADQVPSNLSESIIMEIHKGQHPFGEVVDGTVDIGQIITLVAKARDKNVDSIRYDMFVHSCYATDENKTARVDLIDSKGCMTHSMVLDNMSRLKTVDDHMAVYFFPLKAFKFPDLKDVFFFCSVDIGVGVGPEQMCPVQRKARQASVGGQEPIHLSVYDSVSIADSDPVDQRIEGHFEKEDGISLPMFIAALTVSAALALVCGGIAIGVTYAKRLIS